MKVIIEIPNYEFNNDIADKFQDYFKRVMADIAHGTMCGNYELETTKMFLASFERLQTLPDNATNGDIVKAMFPNVVNSNMDLVDAFNNAKSWWNAPYGKE
jgi:hypothetical protein